MPDSPKARENDHAEFAIELQGNDAERKPRVLHASFNDDGATIWRSECEDPRGHTAKPESESVVQDDDDEGQQQSRRQ